MSRSTTTRLALAIVAALPSALLACPVCDTGTGQQVRAGLFDGNFTFNLLATLLPFPILLGVVAAIHVGWPRRSQRNPSPAESPTEDQP